MYFYLIYDDYVFCAVSPPPPPSGRAGMSMQQHRDLSVLCEGQPDTASLLQSITPHCSFLLQPGCSALGLGLTGPCVPTVQGSEVVLSDIIRGGYLLKVCDEGWRKEEMSAG